MTYAQGCLMANRRMDTIQCMPQNKPCGKRCIPKEQECQSKAKSLAIGVGSAGSALLFSQGKKQVGRQFSRKLQPTVNKTTDKVVDKVQEKISETYKKIAKRFKKKKEAE